MNLFGGGYCYRLLCLMLILVGVLILLFGIYKIPLPLFGTEHVLSALVIIIIGSFLLMFDNSEPQQTSPTEEEPYRPHFHPHNQAPPEPQKKPENIV